MSRRSKSNLIGIIIVAIGGAIFWIIKSIWDVIAGLCDSKKNATLGQPKIDDVKLEKEKYWEEQRRKQREEAKKKEEEEKAEFEELKKQFSSSGEKDLIFNESVKEPDKIKLLQACFNYSYSEAEELIETAEKEAKKAKLQKAKKAISKKAFELYGGLPSDDKRILIPDEIKQYVWQRDKGQCAKCGSQENIEFDHIIPVSKGGSNTARNIQILCQDCNRSKSDSVV